MVPWGHSRIASLCGDGESVGMSTYDSNALGRPAMHPTFSLPSILAIVAAIGSFMVHTGTMTLLLAIAALVLGAIGVVIALLPGKRGGIISFLSIGLGAIAVLIALVRFFSNNTGGGTGTY